MQSTRRIRCGCRSYALFGAMLAGVGFQTSCVTPEDVGAGRADGEQQDDDLDPSAPSAPLRRLSIEPEFVALDVTNGAASQAFVVQVVSEDGSADDVTTLSTYTLSDPTFGSVVEGALRVESRAGTAQLVARYGELSVTAEVRVTIDRTVEVPAPPSEPLPDNPAAVFEDAVSSGETGVAPEIVYPLDGTFFPPNLTELELHFMPNGHSLFRVVVDAGAARLTFFTRCQPLEEGCALSVETSSWEELAGTAGGREAVRVTVEGTDDEGTSLGSSETLSFSVAPEKVEGGLYYWATSSRSILRVDFGEISEPEVVVSSANGCVGCHALAPNGERMSTSVGGQEAGWLQLVDVQTQNILVNPSTEVEVQFQSWSPDSTQFVGVWRPKESVVAYPNLTIYDGERGAILQEIPISSNNLSEPSHPDWSPAGDRIAFAKVTEFFSSQRFGRAGISYIQQENGVWASTVYDLVAPEDGVNHYSPTYAPTGEFLLYGKSRCEDTDVNLSAGVHPCNADADPSSQIWAISAEGGTPLLLRNLNLANEGQDLTNTFPKWAPFVDAQFADGSGRLMWVTFSSRRRAGLRAQKRDGGEDQPFNQLLWMAAIDPDAVIRGEDGSFAPFVLPFQDFDTSNHLAQWTQRVVPIEPICTEEGESCLRSEECCEGLRCRLVSETASVCRLVDSGGGSN